MMPMNKQRFPVMLGVPKLVVGWIWATLPVVCLASLRMSSSLLLRPEMAAVTLSVTVYRGPLGTWLFGLAILGYYLLLVTNHLLPSPYDLPIISH